MNRNGEIGWGCVRGEVGLRAGLEYGFKALEEGDGPHLLEEPI